jgi:preprotein translocase subunit SecB
MRPSSLQLRLYFVTELNISVNMEFDPDEEVKLYLKNLVVNSEAIKNPDDEREWQIKLSVQHNQDLKTNSPYFFSVNLVGFFRIEGYVPNNNVAKYAYVNGSSVLYSSAREVLRSAMARGPYEPIMLPTVCFYEEVKQKAED